MFDQMTPEQIADFCRPIFRGEVNSLGGIDDIQIDRAFNQLPQRRPEVGAAVYTILAESPEWQDRRDVAYSIGKLTAANHDVGMRLWDQLIRDPDSSVRLNAYYQFSEAIRPENSELEDERLAELGLTPRDALHLLRAYVEGESTG